MTQEGLRDLEEAYKHKKFRKDMKKHWGFTCNHCERKVFSKTQDDYWIINGISAKHSYLTRYCSEPCSKIAYFEIKNEFLKQINESKEKIAKIVVLEKTL